MKMKFKNYVMVMFFIILLFNFPVFSQNNDGIMDEELIITVGSEPYSEIVGTAITLNLSNSYDDGSGSIQLPFPVRFDTTTYTTSDYINVNANGYVLFQKTASHQSFYSTQFPTAVAQMQCIRLLAGDHCSYNYCSGSANNAEALKYAVEGTAPNRRFIIQYTGWASLSYYSSSTYCTKVQIIIYENTDYEEYPNKIRIHFGQVGFAMGTSTTYNPASAYIMGGTSTRIINFQGDGSNLSFVRGDNTTRYWTPSNLNVYMLQDQYIDFEMETGPTIKDIYPKDTVLGANQYTGDILTPFMKIGRKSDDPIIKASYKIIASDGTTAFEALDPITGSTWIDVDPTLISAPDRTPFTYYFDSARGTRVDRTNPDEPAKLNFRSNYVAGGIYTTIAKVQYYKDSELKENVKETTFEVMYDYDIRVSRVVEPSSCSEIGTQYPISEQAQRFSILIKNVGKSPISDFNIYYKILDSDNRQIWSADAEMRLTTPLEYGEEINHDVSTFVPTDIAGIKDGVYNLYIDLELVDIDEPNIRDNSDTIDICLDYVYDGKLTEISYPDANSVLYKGQPRFPKIKVINKGGFDVDAVPVKATISYIPSAGATPITEYEVIEDIPLIPSKYSNDTTTYEFLTPFFPQNSGNYEIAVELSTDEDSHPADNVLRFNFEVLPSLTGIQRVGTGLDFATITDAVAAIYERGVEDTVTFMLSDPIMEIGSTALDYALDFSSGVAGFDNTKLIRFVPSEQLARKKGAVEIVLTSKSGIGMRFGSSLSSTLPSAPVNLLTNMSEGSQPGHSKLDYYHFNAKVEFDGGSNKSIQFKLASNIQGTNRIPVLIDEGSKNITFRNCIFNGKRVNNPVIPNVLYNAGFTNYTFNDIEKLSAGILVRNIPPMDKNNNNIHKLDTALINNINITENNFLGGSYGIVSLGIGSLYNVRQGGFATYYNNNNAYTKNEFIGIDNAAIFLGYEENTKVAFNRIDLIGVGTEVGIYDNAGIILGGFGAESTTKDIYISGYNNINVTVNGNEISRVYSNLDAYGIKVEQERNNYIHNIKGQYVPAGNDLIKIFNNVVWGLQTKNDLGSKYGIRLFSAREYNSDNRMDAFANPRENDYLISKAQIINNTILIEDDATMNDENSFIGGIVIQNVEDFKAYNNAVTILDNTNTSDIVSPLVLQSVVPNKDNKIELNNNVYYNINGDVVIRFIENSNRDGSISNIGYKDQYLALEQWRYLTATEEFTSINDFSTDLYKTSTSPASLRIKTPAPIGSYLNNRGEIFPEVTTDILGTPRGQAEQAYDIGAWEFEGKSYDNDLEILSFEEPVSVRDYAHPYFGEAEYVMTKSPVNVKVNIRNNGTMKVENREVTLKVSVLDSDGVATLVNTYTKNASINAFDKLTLDFEISKDDPILFPKTYFELGSIHPSPARFKSMERNVTPVYRFEVSLPDDEDNSNNRNLTAKEVRYYIKKSKIGAIVSADSTDLVPVSYTGNYFDYIDKNIEVDTDEMYSNVAGYLNFRAIGEGLNSIGFYYNEKGYDVFDRSKWEPRSIDYSIYRSLFWVDALDDTLTSYQENDIRKFVDGANVSNRKNLVLSSEEISRNSAAIYTDLFERDFIEELFATTPKGNGIWDITNNTEADGSLLLTGSKLISDMNVKIENTELVIFGKDKAFKPAIFENHGSTTHTAAQAFFYTKPILQQKANKTFGVVSSSINDVMVYLGVDWRNYSNPAIILGSILDFIDNFGEEEPELPIELLNFNAFAANNKVYIDWETASEVNTSSFIIEKASNTTSNYFEMIEEISAKRSSNLSNTYSTTDENVFAGNTYTYRLKSIDLNGEHSYSNEKSVTIDGNSNFISLDKPTPNPAKDILNITFNLSADMNVRLSIYDLSGREIAVIKDAHYNAAKHDLSFSLINIPSGSYSLVMNADGNIISHSFTITR